MANWGLNEVNQRHQDLLRQAQRAQRDHERLQAQESDGMHDSLAWPESIRVFLRRFSWQTHLKDTHWNAKSPSTTPKRLPSAQES